VRSEREMAGFGDIHSEMQPTSMPNVDASLVGVRLDVCFRYDLDEGGHELRWCQGEVTLVSDGSNLPIPNKRNAKYKAGEAVAIRWDANEECNELPSETVQKLPKSKWNPKKHCEGGWRLDVEVGAGSNT
jgi:hypothetical protein